MKFKLLMTMCLSTSAFAMGDGRSEAVNLCRSISNELVVSQCLEKIGSIGSLDLDGVMALRHINNDLVKLSGLDAIANKFYPPGVAAACISGNDLITVNCLARSGQ